MYFVLNPSPQNDNDGDGTPDLAPALMEVYDDPAPALVKALKENVSTVSNIYEDKWGVFVSAYAPFYNESGELVGTLGMDLELNNFYERLQPIKIAFEKTVVIIIFIGLVIGLLFWYIRKHTQVLLGYKENSQEKINKSLDEVQNAYKESVAVLRKIDKNLMNEKNSSSDLYKRVSSWIKHIVEYQNSKILKTMDLECNFEFYQLVQKLESKLKRAYFEVELVNELEYPLKVKGMSMDIYVDSTFLILEQMALAVNNLSLKINILQLEEGVNNIVVELRISTQIKKEDQNKIYELISPKIDLETDGFNNRGYNGFMAIQALRAGQCLVETNIRDTQLELRIIMQMLK